MTPTQIPKPKWPPAERMTPRKDEPRAIPRTNIKQRQRDLEGKVDQPQSSAKKQVQFSAESIPLPASSSPEPENNDDSRSTSAASSPVAHALKRRSYQPTVEEASPDEDIVEKEKKKKGKDDELSKNPSQRAGLRSDVTLISKRPKDTDKPSVVQDDKRSRQVLASKLEQTIEDEKKDDIPSNKREKASRSRSRPSALARSQTEGQSKSALRELEVYREPEIMDLLYKIEKLDAATEDPEERKKGYTIAQIFDKGNKEEDDILIGKQESLIYKLFTFISFFLIIVLVLFLGEQMALHNRYCTSFNECADKLEKKVALIRSERCGESVSTGPILRQPFFFKNWPYFRSWGHKLLYYSDIVVVMPLKRARSNLELYYEYFTKENVQKSTWEKIGDLKYLVVKKPRKLTYAEKVKKLLGI